MTFPDPTDPVTAMTRPDGTTEPHSTDHGRVIQMHENARHHGAFGNSTLDGGGADDTQALQNCIDTAIGGTMSATIPTPTRYAYDDIARVYVPAGLYRITAPLVFRGVRGIQFYGAGREATIFVVDGTMTQAFQLLGLSFSNFSGFSIVGKSGFAGAGHVTSAITWDWTPSETDTSSSRVTFSDIWIRDLDFKYGWAIGSNSGAYDVSNGMWDNCHVSGNHTQNSGNTTQWQAAWFVGSGTSGNVLNHYLSNCHLLSTKHGVYVNNVNNVSLTNVEGFDHESYLYRVGSGSVSVRDSRIEETQMFADTLGGATYVSHLLAENFVWSPGSHGETNGRFVKWNYCGTVVLRCGQLELPTNNSNVQHIYIDIPAGRKTFVNVEGLTVFSLQNAATFVEVSGPAPDVLLDARALMATDSSGTIVTANMNTQIAYNDNAIITLGSTETTGTSGTDAASSMIRLAHAADAASANGVVAWNVGGTDKWWLYKSASAAPLYLRDIANSRMQATFTAGASSTAAITELASELKLLGPLNHDGTTVGFYAATPVAQQVGVAVTAAAIHAALVNLGLITA